MYRQLDHDSAIPPTPALGARQLSHTSFFDSVPSLLPLVSVSLALGLSACGGGGSAVSSTEHTGELLEHPDTGIGSSVFVGESHFHGLASDLHLTGVFWGRRASVADSSGEVVLRDFVIADSIRDESSFSGSDGETHLIGLERNGITGTTLVRLPVPLDSEDFLEGLLALERDLTPVFDKGVGPDEMGPFTMVARNAALVLRFDDLLETRFDNGGWRDSSQGDVINAVTGQLNADVIELRSGYPAIDLFETRIIADPNHGGLLDLDGDGDFVFHSTRVIVCSTVTELESRLADPPLLTNTQGLPPSSQTNSSNLVLRVPTDVNPAVGQTRILQNSSGHGLGGQGNGSTDDSLGTLDIVRAMRSGGSLTQDAHNGFLLDEESPRLIGEFSVTIDANEPPEAIDVERPERFLIPKFHAAIPVCSPRPKVGDLLIQEPVYAIVVEPGIWNGASVHDMVVDVLTPLGGEPRVGLASLQTPFDPALDNPQCFVGFSPDAMDAPLAEIPVTAQVILRFSEPMDPASLGAFDSFSVTRVASEFTPYDYVVGKIRSSPDLRTFRFDHDEVPFRHQQGLAETYYVNLRPGQEGPRDLAGNALQFNLPQIAFQVRASDPTSVNDGFAMRFHTADEFNGDGLFELRNGQMLYDPVNERILPRPVSRYEVSADRNQPVPSVMSQFPGGIQTPLSKLGSKLQALWRYCDVGFSLTDETNVNVDIEGISWAPVEPTVVTDVYDEFGIILAHSEWLPDEYLIPMGPGTGLPMYPGSGVKMAFDANLNDAANDPGTWVHPKESGYIVNATNLYLTASGTQMLPYPMNQDIPLEEYRYYTWRDTALTAVGGNSGAGAMLDQEDMVINGGTATPKTYGAGMVPTVGLPLLMEFRCYPSDAALGLNALDISLAANSSARPNFRAFSTGGHDSQGFPNPIDPDDEPTAQGGYNPNSSPAGNPTPGTDNAFYIGELALVTRVSRIHTVWFDTSYARARFARPVLEPESQPSGTSLVLAYRGAINISGQGPTDILHSAAGLDFYGNSVVTSAPTLFGSGQWVDDIAAINDARYFQVRLSFVNNAATGQTASLDSMAFAYFDATP